jgi:signal transduction histidine kinase
VSTAVGQVESPATTDVPHPGMLGVVATAGLLAGVGGFLLVATSNHLVDPVAYGLLVADVVVGSVGVAVYWLVRRPGNRTARILLGISVAAAGVSLQGATNPLLHSIGVLFDPVVFCLAYYAVFAYPYGRLTEPLDRALAVAPVVVTLSSFLPWFFFSPVVAGTNPLARCNEACPRNALMIANRPEIAAGIGRAEHISAAVIALAIVTTIVFRLATSTRPRTRALVPVYVPALLLTIPFGLFQAAGASLIRFDADTLTTLGWFVVAGRGTLSYGFLAALVLASVFAADALTTLVDGVGETPTPHRLQTLVAEVLDDSSLRLAFRDSEGLGFVDVSGERIVPTSTGAGRVASAVRRGGETVAYVVHDEALRTDPELIRAAGQAMILALESGRLETELRSTIAELHASRARIGVERDGERRRIERDLHDGAQQHLFALGVKVDLAAQELAGQDPLLARQLFEVGEGLDEVLDELRRFAQGVYPPLLRDFGLETALAAVAKRSSPPAGFDGGRIGRYPDAVESAIYFCCVEALQNVAKHAGDGARAEVRLWTSDGALCFEVADDGIGLGAGRGNGQANMADRLAVVGGTLTIDSAGAGGTIVSGVVPLGPMPA